MKKNISINTPLQQVFAAVVIFVLVVGFIPTVTFGENPHTTFPNNPNIDICHATQSDTNPYSNGTQLVNANSIINGGNAHNNHSDGGYDDKGDIIPPFDYDLGDGPLHYDGKNWEGEYIDIYNNDCEVPEEPVVGCMDDTATNYNPDATEDDDPSLCEYPEPDPVVGCMDEAATNYNPLATEDEDPTLCQYPDPDVEVATLVAHKIVCTDEADLPNWGTGGANITSDTAADWVASHESCSLESGWEFEWGPKNVFDPGDTLTGPAGGDWTTFGPTNASGKAMTTLTEDDINGDTHIWVREVLKDGYIPFSYGPNGNKNTDDVSAEMYCHIDVLNYDNYDRVDGITVGATYNCVAWNVLEEDDQDDEEGKIVVFKKVLDNDGLLQPNQFDLFVMDDASVKTEVYFGVPKHFALGTYTIGEEAEDGYEHVKTYCEVANKDDFDDVWDENDYFDYVDWSFDGEVTLDEDGDIALCLVVNKDTDTNDGGGGGNGGTDDDLYLVYGYVWHDADEDMVWDGVDEEEVQDEEEVPESALGGWTVRITDGTDTFTTQTDEDGYYEFEVPAGTWVISEEVMEEWSQTAPSGETYEVTVPETVAMNFVDKLIEFVIPTAYAQVVQSFGPYNFGNVQAPVVPTPTGGGGSGGGGGSRIELVERTDSNGNGGGTPTPVPSVLAEQVSAMPSGAPNTGAGGTANTALLILLAILGIAVSLTAIGLTRNAQ